ncbi:stage III sporulation protein AG [Clostridium sp. Cult1]|uniref:stage III sporulation protein AG n=1 Tax=Clostridium sp. Cult1 TaxID=2079002 RepID=UPI001F1EC75A|nr:stage III sporulation protein AG [Clostridium sp. Cult1]MCF6464248.1 sporulation stage III protein AG [Clostridium sp. Cult1]
MDKFFDWIKKYLEKVNNKELMRNLFIILIIGIILIIIADIFIKEKKGVNQNLKLENEVKNPTNTETDYGTVLENKLEDVLSQLKGVGSVKVMITLEDTIEKIPAFNTTKNNETTNELDSQGGTREIIREDTTIQVVTGSEGSLIVLKEIKPTIKGVIVIAEGAEDLEVKERLYEAVKTVLGISGSKVEVYASK